MTRWLYLCSDLGIPLDGTKGASAHVRAITGALCRAGQDVSVLAARGSLPPGHPARQVEHSLGGPARELGENLRVWLVSNAFQASMSAGLAQLAFDATLMAALEHDAFGLEVDVVIERLSLFSAAGRDFAQRRGIPYLIEMNSPMAQEAARYRDAGIRLLAQEVEHRTLRAADRVMTVSNDLRNHAIESADLDPTRVTTVPNGVELDLFDRSYDRTAARLEAGVPADATVFGFVGSLKEWHGIDVLLDAFSKLRATLASSHLLIIGDGRRIDDYRQLADKSGIKEHVTFYGGTDHPTVARLLSGVDVAIAPYLPQPTFYFSPLKLYEYMAAGLCVIASRAGQISEVIDDGKNGFLVPPGDSRSLYDAMLRAGRDAGLRARVGALARRSVALCSWDSTARQIIQLASEALRQRRNSRFEVANAAN